MTDAIDQAFQTATQNNQKDPIDAAWSQATQPPKTGLLDTASHIANYYYGAARTEASKVLSAFSVGFQDKWGANQQIIDKDLKAELQAKGQEKNYKDQNEMNWANWSTILRHGLAEGGNYASATTEATYRAVNQGISDLGKLPSEEELLKLGFKPEDIHKAYQMVKDSGVGPAIKAATHGFERGAAPAAATLAAGVKGAEIGAGLGAMVPGLGETGISEAVGGIAGGVAFGLAGNEAAQKAQDYLLSKVPDKWKSLIGQSDKQQQQEQIKHPLATFTGELLPYAASFRPGLLPKVVPKNASMLTKAIAHPLGQRALSGVLMGDWEAVQELWNEGKTDSDKVAIAAAIGTFFPRNEVAEKVKVLNDNSTAPRIEPTFEKAKANGIIGDEATEEQQRAKAEAVGNLPPSATRNPQPNETIEGPHSVEEALAYQPVTDKTISKDASKMLTDVGRPKNEASAVGTLVQHYFETRAARFKGTLGTPRELFDKEFPEIIKAGKEKPSDNELNQMVFHGSAAGFDKFDNRYIGTGEGAQMYGVGHYFADKRDVAEFYRAQEASKTSEGKGYVYTAELTPKDHEWLDLDKNVQDQSPEIQDRLRKAGLWNGERMTTHGLQTEIAKGLYFGDIQQARAMTSRALHQAGIPGLRYTGLTHKLEVAKAEQDLPIYKEQLENARLVRDITKRQQLSSLPLKEDTVNKLQATVDRLERLTSNPTAYNYVVFDPENVNIVNKEYYQDHEGKTRETFYSALSHGVEDIKQSKAPSDQWLKTIKNIKGIKKEELDWSGIETWLKSQTGKVSKEDIQKFLAENQVDVKEVIKKGISSDPDNFNSPKYAPHVLPGGKDYRELLLTLPKKDEGLYGLDAARAYNRYSEELHQKYGDGIALKATPEELQKLHDLDQRSVQHKPNQEFRSGHWDEPNVLAHVRFDTRAGANGEKILHVAEIQSDWHQKGRRQGYGDSPEKKRLQEQQEELRGNRPVTFETQQLLNHFDGNREDALAEVTHALNGGSFRDGIPDAPFKQSWHELAIKRMLRYATDNGFDRLSWDTGETNADRFSLSHQVSEIRYFPSEGGALLFKTIDGHQHQLENISPEKLDDYIGKEAADRIKNKINKDDTEVAPTGNKYVRLEGLDLKIGGEGMKGFYDKILTDFVKRYTKKWGAEVKDIPLTYDLGDINKEFDLVERGGHWYIKDLASDIVLNTAFNSGADAEKWLKENYSKQTQVHSVSITPKMKESVQEGQPLFQRGKRGSLVLQDGRNVLKIFEVADHSTVIHELGHDWLEALHRDAAHENAPEDIKRDMGTTRDWYNSKRGRSKAWTGDDIPRSAHEMWARGVERYLMEGKAPSKELATVFAKFKAWLTRIYQAVTKLKSPINDDVRAVFDRLLSTEPQKTEIADVPEKATPPEAAEEPLPQDAGEGVPTAKAPLPEKEKTETAIEFSQSKADLITPDGKFRVKQLTSYDDLDRATKSFITRNINKIEARKGKLTDEDIVNYASNLGLDPKDSDHTKLDALFGGPDVPLAGKVYAVGQYMQDATKALVEAIEAEDVESAVVLRQNLVKSMAIFAGKIRPDWGYTGRALQSLYGEAEKANALNEFFQSTIGKNTKEFKAELSRMKALAKKRGITVEELVKQLRAEAEPKLGHMINEFYRSNLITGIMTHLHYFEANKMWALWRAYPTTAFQAGASSIMQMFSKEPIDKVRWGELAEISYNLKYAQAEALKAAADSFKVGQSVGRTMQRVAKEKADYELSKGLITDKNYLGRVNELIAKPTEAMVVEASPPKNITASKAIPSPWGDWIRLGGEKIAAPLHSEAYVFSFELKKSQLIYREARNRGFTGTALANKIAELKYDTPINILTEARTEALKATLMSNQSRLAKYLTGISRFELKNSGLQPLVPFEPFISIAADIFHIATFDALPLGVFTKDIRDKAIGKQGPVKQAEAAGNLTLGLALMGTVAGWMGDGLFNGPGSSDKKKALLDRMTTGYPYSFHIGNQAISIERFGVLGTAISLASDFIKIAEYIKPDDPSYKQFLQAGWGVIHNLGEHLLQGIGPMSGFSKIFDIAKNQSAAEQFARKTIALYEPGSIFFSQAARQLDPYQRDTSDSDPIQAIINQLKVQTPGVSKGLPPRIDIWGQPEPNEKFLGVYMQEVQNDPVMQYFQRHPQNFPSPVRQPQKFKLTHEQLVEYQMKAGLYLKQSLNQLLTPTFEEMSEHSQHLMIQDQVSMARSQAMMELQTKYQGTPHDILKQQLKAQEDMLK